MTTYFTGGPPILKIGYFPHGRISPGTIILFQKYGKEV